MAGEDETRAQPWGTLEELLLAYAVNRHGTESWDSIAVEVQKRPSALPSLTWQNCKEKYNDLKRRFGAATMVDELRRIRVEELRREVQRCDVSIVSLEMKVKRLEEDREKSLKEEEADLAREKKKPLRETTASGDDSIDERENRSYNESNSTSQQKARATMVKAKNDIANENPDTKPDPKMKTKPDPVRKGTNPEAGRGWSQNCKLEDDDDENGGKKAEDKKEEKSKPGRAVVPGAPSELRESVGDSKRDEKEKKEQNSDVQSSTSLSLTKKKRLRRVGAAGVASSSGEEPEVGDEVSPATKRVPAAKSEPLAKLLGIIRSHRLGSMFERRTRSQESERFKNLIRQHIDLQTVQSKLDKGVYSNSPQMFFRDLLLLFNNAIIFFRKSSPENLAASELRAVICKEMAEQLGKPKPKPQPVTMKQAAEQEPIPFSKPNKSSTMVVCGKRSSVKAAPETANKYGNRKDEEGEEKPNVVNKKKIEDSFATIEEKGIRKKRSKEWPLSVGRGSRTCNKNGEIKHQYGGNELSSHDSLEIKVERKESSWRKRQGAASFLKRMKQNSPGEVTENDDDASDDESKDGRVEEKKMTRRNGDATKARVTRSSRGRSAREENSKVNRGVGRPPKRQATSTPELAGGLEKRGRENGDSEVGIGGSGRARKRSRR